MPTCVSLTNDDGSHDPARFSNCDHALRTSQSSLPRTMCPASHWSRLRVPDVTFTHVDVGTVIVLRIALLHAAIACPLRSCTANPPVPTVALRPAFRFHKHHLQGLHFTNSNAIVLATPAYNDDVPPHRIPTLDSTLRASTQFPPQTSMYKTQPTSLQIY